MTHTTAKEWADDVLTRVTGEIVCHLKRSIPAGHWHMALSQDYETGTLIIEASQSVMDYANADVSADDYTRQTMVPQRIKLTIGVGVEVCAE